MIIYQPFNSSGNYNYDPRLYDNYQIIQHFHENFELIYVIDGNIEVMVNDRIEVLQKHEFALVLPNQIHALHTPQSSFCWIGVFSDNYVYEFAKYIGEKEGETSKFVCADHIMQYVEKELIREEPSNLLLLKSMLYAVCYEYIRQVPLHPQRKTNTVSHQIIQYISQHYSQEITLKDLAENLGYEYHYLSRCFNSTFHRTFKTFLNQYRCERAKNLLLHQLQSITSIAYESGFQSIRNFNRVFKEYTGMEPSNYARQILQKF